MTVSLTDDQRQAIALAEELTEVTVRDCVFDEAHDRVVFLVAAGEMGKAIGKGGETVKRLQERMGQEVKLVEDAPTAETFVANALAPAAVESVTIEEEDDGQVAYADVDERDTGAAIGKDGRTIELARELAARHFDIDDVQLA